MHVRAQACIRIRILIVSNREPSYAHLKVSLFLLMSVKLEQAGSGMRSDFMLNGRFLRGERDI